MGRVPSDSWFRERAEASGDVFFITRIHPDVCTEFISETVLADVGHTADELMDDHTLFHVVDDEALMSMQPGDQRSVEITWQAADGSLRYTQVSALCRRREDGSVVLEGVARDITELRRAQQALAESETRFRLLAENAWDVIWTMALDGTITYVSPSVERVRGITPEEAAAQTLEQIHPPASQASVMAYYQRLFSAMAAGDELPVFRGEHEYYRKDGSIMTGELQVIPQVDDDGRPVQILGVTRDVSERKQWEANLAQLAVTDSLTGVCNRRHGEELMRAMLTRNGPVSLLMLDLDHFKLINDSGGHRAGDEALMQFCQRVRDLLRPGDVFARWGGEEFVVALPCDAEVAVRRAEEIRAITQQQAGTTVSIGVASGADADLDELLHAADAALYQAKAAGRNCVRTATARPLPPSPA